MPFKLAICVVQNPVYAFTIRPENKDKILSLSDQLKKKGIISDMFFIPDSSDGLRHIRFSAAQHGADAVLVIRSASDTDNYSNPFSLLYLTIIGFWIAPGSNSESLFYINSSMWDVRNEYLYFSAEAEGIGKTIRPLMFSNKLDSIYKAREAAVDNYKDEVLKRLTNLKGK